MKYEVVNYFAIIWKYPCSLLIFTGVIIVQGLLYKLILIHVPYTMVAKLWLVLPWVSDNVHIYVHV